jgi:hypothetical protein
MYDTLSMNGLDLDEASSRDVRAAPLVLADPDVDLPEQFSVLGSLDKGRGIASKDTSNSTTTFFNTSVPFSALVCGAQVCSVRTERCRLMTNVLCQGMGKSHTISTLLESLLSSPTLLGANTASCSGLL